MEDEEEDGGVRQAGPGDGGAGRAAPRCSRSTRARTGDWVQELSPELRHGYRILSHFLQDKHRSLCQPFLLLEPGEESKGEAVEDRRRDQGEAGPRERGLSEGGVETGQGEAEEGNLGPGRISTESIGMSELEDTPDTKVESDEIPQNNCKEGNKVTGVEASMIQGSVCIREPGLEDAEDISSPGLQNAGGIKVRRLEETGGIEGQGLDNAWGIKVSGLQERGVINVSGLEAAGDIKVPDLGGAVGINMSEVGDIKVPGLEDAGGINMSEVGDAGGIKVPGLEDTQCIKAPELHGAGMQQDVGVPGTIGFGDKEFVEVDICKSQTGVAANTIQWESGKDELNSTKIPAMSSKSLTSVPDNEEGSKSVHSTEVEPGLLCRVPGSLSLLKMEEKFSSGQYRSIGDFVSDFRMMLEGCYKLHGVDHWLSKQAQKLELMLEQKLSLLSRNLREKTSIVVTSKGRYGLEYDKMATCTSARRRSTTRSLSSLNSGSVESVMVQVLRQEEELTAKEGKRFDSEPPVLQRTHFLRSCRSAGRLRDQERREAEEANQKEMEEWDRNLLALAGPTPMETMWEIPAIGHFLCLAQQILNLPEIVFYELERCLLMPQCNVFLAKIMTSLLSPPHRRPTLHRRPNLPYRAWEAALRQKVQQWYTVVGQAENPDRCAEKLGLCSQFFRVLGEVSPLELATFHELPFYKKVWLIKGLCDFVYETQSEVQDAVLGQPIHECREVILGYDAQENAYIHFPQFCGADVRVYKQRPFRAPEFPVPRVQIKRTPRIKLERAKCKYSNKCNGEIESVRYKAESPSPDNSLEKSFEYNDDGNTQFHTDSCSSGTDQDVNSVRDVIIHQPCDPLKISCCKENLEKPNSPGEVIGYGEPLSPGEIRILESVDKFGEPALVKLDPCPLKDNALKTCQMHVNGNQTDSTDIICHRVARDILLDHSLQNHKKLKLSKMRAKKKKKKKKKLKDLLNENIQGQFESHHTHTFVSYKTEIQNKLFLSKKKAKHKKHKSGKKSVSKKVVAKKRRTVTGSPAVPEFQLVCTNLDELRDLIRKIEGELKDLECNKKKSEKWYFRRQGVKELHSTLIRLLNELLPWEPKLLKAFQRNRARLKKDYDDFKKQPFDEFTRESASREGCDVKKSPNSVTNALDICPQEILNKDYIDKLKLLEMGVSGKGKVPRRESFPRDLLKPKTCKRQCKRFSYPDHEGKEVSPRKKIKLNIHETSSQCADRGTLSCCSVKDQQQTEPETPAVMADSVAGLVKGTKPIQALLAKNIGNKVTLTNQFAPCMNRIVPVSENSPLSSTEAVPVKPSMSCQAASKPPLQMVYKLPNGQCVPIDLQNSSVKIQMQPIIDSKTGEKVMQQVLFLPKNLFVQHKEGHTFVKGGQSLQSSAVVQSNISNGALQSSPTGCITADTTSQPKNVMQLTKFATPVLVSPSVSTSTSTVVTTQCETSNTVSETTFPSTVVPPAMAITVPSVAGGTKQGRGTTAVSHHTDASLMLTEESLEPKQELKTVCIRDSQSILVRTRGGNTGVVKVQTSHDQSSSIIGPSPIFTFTPQLQSFLVSKSKTSTSSTFTPISPTTPPLLPSFPSSPAGLSPTSSSVSGGLNHLHEKHATSSKSQPPGSGNQCKVLDKPMQPSNFLSTISSTSSWLPPSPQSSHGKTNIITDIMSPLSSDKIGQSNSFFTPPATDIKQKEPKLSNIQPDSTTTSQSDSGYTPTLHKVMLVTAPPILSPVGGTKVNMLTTPASSVVSTPKLLFINAQVPPGPSSACLALQATKQSAPSVVGKTYVKTAEQPQIFLIPSTIGSPVKMSPAPIVSQVKDVKIGLTIGQTIVNTSGSSKNMLPVNILQNALAAEDCIYKGFGISGTANAISGAHNGALGASTKDGTNPTVKNTFSCAAVSSTSNVKAQCTNSDRNVNNGSGNLPALSNRLCSTNVGNTVAISTVKTGHLSSSVLLSNTQMTGHTRNAMPSLQMPISSTGFASGMTPQLLSTPTGVSYQNVSKEVMEKVQFSSPRLPKMLATNVNKPQVVLTPPLVSKSDSTSGSSQGSSNVLHPTPAPAITQLRGPLNDSCIQQKIVINTSTPLAPGTQITINGTRFIIPPQGLGAGSHVLLISTNAKQGSPSVNNPVQMGPGFPTGNSIVQQTPEKQNMSSIRHTNHTFNVSKSMNSFGTTKSLPIVHAAPNIVNVTSTDISSYPVPRVDVSSLSCAQSTAALKSCLVPVVPSSSLQQPFPRDMSVDGGAIINTMNSQANRTLLSPAKTSDNKNADPAFPAYRPSVPDKPHTVAS
ncbi:putative bromodomain-containing protein 10 [Discoglossus pictus]